MKQMRFRGWQVVAASVVGLACGVATTVVALFGVFLGPLRAQFGWSLTDSYAALLITTFVAAFIAPLIGGFVDRFGARRIVLASFVCEALIFASFAWQSATLWTFYARYVAFALFGLGTSHVAFARVITLWFDRRRGLALGITLSGIGIGGVLWPLLAQLAVDRFGWRMAFVIIAIAIATIALTLIGSLLIDSPQIVGQLPDGDDPANQQPRRTTAERKHPDGASRSLPEALRTRRYWLVLLTFFLIGMSVQSVMVHLIPLLKISGLSAMQAAFAQSLLFAAVTTGRLSTGALMDRFFAPRVAAAFLVAPLLGMAMLALGVHSSAAFCAALLLGLAVGAEVDVLAYLTSRNFGPKSFSQIYGTYYGVYSLSGGLGPLLTARSVDATGSYRIALLAHMSLLAVAVVLLLIMKPVNQM